MGGIFFQKTALIIFIFTLLIIPSCACALAEYESVSYEIINEGNSVSVKTKETRTPNEA